MGWYTRLHIRVNILSNGDVSFGKMCSWRHPMQVRSHICPVRIKMKPTQNASYFPPHSCFDYGVISSTIKVAGLMIFHQHKGFLNKALLFNCSNIYNDMKHKSYKRRVNIGHALCERLSCHAVDQVETLWWQSPYLERLSLYWEGAVDATI